VLAERIALAMAFAPVLLLALLLGWLTFSALLVTKGSLLVRTASLTAKAGVCALATIGVIAQVLRVQITVDHCGVQIRNRWRKRRLRWQEIDEFVASERPRRAPFRRPRGAALYACLHSGEMIAIEAVYVPSLKKIRGRRSSWQREMDALNADLHAARASAAQA